jgi:hypothetical protein
MLAKNVEKTRKIIEDLLSAIPQERRNCACGKALEGALL